jgi:hypothetical protein
MPGHCTRRRRRRACGDISESDLIVPAGGFIIREVTAVEVRGTITPGGQGLWNDRQVEGQVGRLAAAYRRGLDHPVDLGYLVRANRDNGLLLFAT